MKAKIESRLVKATSRHDLGSIAPLASPFVLIIDPSSTCNFKCTFCPTGDHDLIKKTGRFQGPMKFETFTKIIDDAAEFDDPIKVLRLYKEGEPLMNKQLPEMIAYARASSNILRIDTTTNGFLLTPRTSEKIIAAGIDQINISVNGVRSDQFAELVKAKVDFVKYVENIRYLHSIKGKCEIYVKAIYENLTEDERQIFLDTFGDIADRIFFEHLFKNWPNFNPSILDRDFTVAQYGQVPHERAVCPYIFYSITLNSDGTVSLCIQDWARKLVVGSIHEQSLKDIWLSDSLRHHQIAHLEGRRKDNPTCADCGVAMFGVYDDLDAYAPDIRRRLDERQYYQAHQ